MKCDQTYLTYCVLYFSLLILFSGIVSAQSTITHNENHPDVPIPLLGSWIDEHGSYRFEIQKEYCGVDDKLWTYQKITEEEGSLYLDIENGHGSKRQYTFIINNRGEISLQDKYLGKTLHLVANAYSSNFRKIGVEDLPSNFFGQWSPSFDDQEILEIGLDGVIKNGVLWTFHQILWAIGKYRITLKHENSFLLWVPTWNQEGKLSDIFVPYQFMTRQDLSTVRRRFSSRHHLLTKNLRDSFVIDAPTVLQINQMPPRLFGNWSTHDGTWRFNIRKEFIGIDQKAWKYHKITQINGQYEFQLEHEYNYKNAIEAKVLTIRFIADHWIEVIDDGNRYELLSLPHNESFHLANSGEIPAEVLGNWFHVGKNDTFNTVINSEEMIWRGDTLVYNQIVKKDNIFYFTCSLKGRFHLFKMSLLENGYLHVQTEGKRVLFSRQKQFLSKRMQQIIATTGLLIFILLTISRWRTRQKQKEAKRRHRELELELKALRSQMNPHFLFNSLSSIQNLINKQDPEQANIYLSKFSRLLRSVLNNSESPLILLEEEIELLTLYCELEALRFKFDYKIEVESSLDIHQWEIPVMLIQPFVENAIHHGIGPAKRKGKLTISFSESNDLLRCTIIDNGIGINYSQSIKGAKKIGKKHFGIRIAEERIKMLNKQYGDRLKLKITDRGNNSHINTGTRVDVLLPSSFN